MVGRRVLLVALGCGLLASACGGSPTAARTTTPTAATAAATPPEPTATPANPTPPASPASPPATPAAPAPPPPPPAPGQLGMDSEIVCWTQNAEAALAYDDGVQRFNEGDVPAAIAAYQHALLLDPRFCDAMDNLAVLHRRAGRLDEAIVLYERSLAIAPANQVAWQNIGVAYRMRQRPIDAIRAYRQLTVLAPDNPEGWYGLAQTAYLSDRLGEVIAPARRAEALYVATGSPLVGDARLLIGMAAAKLGDQALVRATLEPLYEQFGDEVDVNRALGRAYRDVDADKSRRYLQRAAALSAPPASE